MVTNNLISSSQRFSKPSGISEMLVSKIISSQY